LKVVFEVGTWRHRDAGVAVVRLDVVLVGDELVAIRWGIEKGRALPAFVFLMFAIGRIDLWRFWMIDSVEVDVIVYRWNC
jgi:hypothetical protein